MSVLRSLPLKTFIPLLFFWNFACGEAPSSLEDPDNLLTGTWRFQEVLSEGSPSPLFQAEQLLIAQEGEDLRILLEGQLFSTSFQRVAVGAAGPRAFLFQISFGRLESAAQYEVLSLTLDGRLDDLESLMGVYELRGNLDSGGELRLESWTFNALRQ